MNPSSVAEARELAKATDNENLVICPPLPFIEAVKGVVKKARLGAQDLFWKNPVGPFTGEVSAAELKSLGVEYIIIGHSERRRLGETDDIISQKLAVALEAGLIPILCVGETLEQKNSGQKEKVISEQIKTSLSQLSPLRQGFEGQANIKGQMSGDIYVAVEPVWAISTNADAEVDNPENTLSTINFIKNELLLKQSSVNDQMLNVRFLYGGSVSSSNTESFLKHSEIEGALVGGASLKSEEMAKIINIARSF